MFKATGDFESNYDTGVLFWMWVNSMQVVFVLILFVLVFLILFISVGIYIIIDDQDYNLYIY